MKNHTMKSTDSTRKRKNDSTAKNDGKKIHTNGHGHPAAIDHHHNQEEGLNLTLTLAYTNAIPKPQPIIPPPSLPIPQPLRDLPPGEFNNPQFHQYHTLTSPNQFSFRSDTPPTSDSPPPLQITPSLSSNVLPRTNFRRNETVASDQSNIQRREYVTVPTPRPPRPRKISNSEENKTLTPPYPWAANKRATVHSLEELTTRNIEIITGLVQCRRCEKQYEIGFNLREKFIEVGSYIANNKEAMHDRAPSVWMSPILPTCKFCEQENSVKPVISKKKKSINWLFLLLGQMLGCCTLEQLKYFCKHTENHRTGAKDRVLYLTYLGLCKQLDPDGPFDR